MHLLRCKRDRALSVSSESVRLVFDGVGFPLEDEDVPWNSGIFTRGMRTANVHYMLSSKTSLLFSALFSIHIHTHYFQKYASIIYQGLGLLSVMHCMWFAVWSQYPCRSADLQKHILTKLTC